MKPKKILTIDEIKCVNAVTYSYNFVTLIIFRRFNFDPSYLL
jgi:hypothetical protein